MTNKLTNKLKIPKNPFGLETKKEIKQFRKAISKYLKQGYID